jgi:hypothetical protein
LGRGRGRWGRRLGRSASRGLGRSGSRSHIS